MKIGRKFNELTLKEYIFYIDNYKKYTDFNTLGLYRSICENHKLDLSDKIEVREYAHKTFKKFYEFLQVKDLGTYIELLLIGQEPTKGEEKLIYLDIKANQQKILADKKIKHRSSGIYSKHLCHHDDCPFNGLMIKQDSPFQEFCMKFNSDKNKYALERKVERRKVDKRQVRKVIQSSLDTD